MAFLLGAEKAYDREAMKALQVASLTHILLAWITMILSISIFSCAASLNAPAARELDGRELAKALRDNVVKIKNTESNKEGSGLIIGEKDSILYIATAGHVIEACNKPDIKFNDCIKISFYNIIEVTDCISIEHSAYDGKTRNSDWAIITAKKPNKLYWKKNQLVENVEKSSYDNEKVWTVNPHKNWDVTLDASSGGISINEFEETIDVETLRITEGLSGAPLITPHEIVGVIVEGSGLNGGIGISLNKIKKWFDEKNLPFGYGFARLTVETQPENAIVKLDGVKIGFSNLHIYVKPGEYLIEIEKDGYEKYKKRVEINSDDLQKLEIELREKKYKFYKDGRVYIAAGLATGIIMTILLEPSTADTYPPPPQ